jgi:ABC-type nickel/cobalt efflux system permease component RcnA
VGRIGWHEIAVAGEGGVKIYDSSAFANTLTNELREYPGDLLAAPLAERTAELSFTSGELPAGARPLLTRNGRRVETTRDRLAELIAVKDLTLGVALAGLLLAAFLGGFHAFSPGHGKTVVAAYLIGSRGTAKHAAFLGLTVTLTHTAGVFALGVVTLFAAQYVVPEKLYPILSFVSGAIVVAIGFSLFVRRVGTAFGYLPHSHGQHTHDGREEAHTHRELDSHAHEGAPRTELTHSHDGGGDHSHLPPGADGGAVTWRNLLALGISGGLLPCPSALVVLLSAISFQRVGYGLLLVVSFSVGLASVLTGIGLLFVYARRWMERPLSSAGMLVRVLPALSAFAITGAGVFICYQAIGEAGYSVPELGRHLLAQGVSLFHDSDPDFARMSALAVLGLGFVFGLKHATEVDHVVAVSAIVSQQRKLWHTVLVGGLWGVGHTASLIVVGSVVLVLRVAIPERVASGLEFCVALMIIGLGVTTFIRAARRRHSPVHVHPHRHDGLAHAHVHFHEPELEHTESAALHSHAVSRVGIKPLIIGAMHGLAGSAALTLLVLAQIPSPLLGMLYLMVFGLGSILGMLLMSGLIGLPFVLSVRKLTGLHYSLQAGAGVLSVCFGLWYAYSTGIASGLLSGVFSVKSFAV